MDTINSTSENPREGGMAVPAVQTLDTFAKLNLFFTTPPTAFTGGTPVLLS